MSPFYRVSLSVVFHCRLKEDYHQLNNQFGKLKSLQIFTLGIIALQVDIVGKVSIFILFLLLIHLSNLKYLIEFLLIFFFVFSSFTTSCLPSLKQISCWRMNLKNIPATQSIPNDISHMYAKEEISNFSFIQGFFFLPLEISQQTIYRHYIKIHLEDLHI
jgi:hypothetical protein